MRKQVEAWQKFEPTDVTAKVVIYEAFVEGRLETPKHPARAVHDLYFEPRYDEFRPRTIWSLSNAFASAFQSSVIRGGGPAGTARVLRTTGRIALPETLQISPSP